MEKANTNLVKPRQNSKQKKKFAPFTRAQRKDRREEVYKLHFEHGMPATRIAELMKVDKNTINNDLKILYRKTMRDYYLDSTLDDIIYKQLLRLETQRDRLGLYLSDAKEINNKMTIERLLSDIDFKVLGIIDKIRQNTEEHYNEVMKHINNIAEEEGLKMRFTTLFQLRKISIDTRQDLDKLVEKAWGAHPFKRQKQEQKEQKQEEQIGENK
jgi:DNA-binding CsgD family transcriptional regulator